MTTARWGRLLEAASDVAEMGESWFAGDGSAVGGFAGKVWAWTVAAARVRIAAAKVARDGENEIILYESSVGGTGWDAGR